MVHLQPCVAAADGSKGKKRAIGRLSFPTPHTDAVCSPTQSSSRRSRLRAKRLAVALVPPSGHNYHFRVHRAAAPPYRALVEMLINLLPVLYAVLFSTERAAAYDSTYA